LEEGRVETVIEIVAVKFWADAVIRAEPEARARTLPVPSTLATEGADDCHAAPSKMEPSIFGCSWRESPTRSVVSFPIESVPVETERLNWTALGENPVAPSTVAVTTNVTVPFVGAYQRTATPP
jgi:hypothetical protein